MFLQQNFKVIPLQQMLAFYSWLYLLLNNVANKENTEEVQLNS